MGQIQACRRKDVARAVGATSSEVSSSMSQFGG